MNKKKIKRLPEGKIRLNDGIIVKYKIDNKGKHIARVEKGYIITNKEFKSFLRNPNEKKTVIYHEKQHLKWFNKILEAISRLLFPLILFLFFIALLGIIILIFYFNDINLILFCPLILSFVSLFILFILTNYLNEILCDFNAIKNMGIRNFNNSIIRYYQTKNKNDFINHPHWKWRKKIMGSLDSNKF